MTIHRSSGLTLLEVALSLLIVSVAVVSVMLLFPVGIKTQTMARFQIYAAAKAIEMADAYTTFHNGQPAIDIEAPAPWMVGSSYGNLMHDLEKRVSSYRYGIMPLPLDIVRRLDSDNDEIQRILDQGGQIYYSQAQATTNFKDATGPDLPPNESQKLVFAISGLPQSNAMPYFPWKAWPYYIPWPSPPIHGPQRGDTGFTRAAGDPNDNDVADKGGLLWEHTSDPDISRVFELLESTAPDVTKQYGYRPYRLAARGGGGVDPKRAAALRYVQIALWYAREKGLPTALYDTETPILTFVAAPDEWKQVQGLRFLAHAASCLTAWHTRAALDGGIDIPTVTFAFGGASPAIRMTTGKIAALHDSSMNLAMSFAANRPYDWGAPRPLNRTIMMDHPLIEWDIYHPQALTGPILGAGVNATQWRPLPASPIRNIGRSQCYQDDDIPTIKTARWGQGGGVFGDQSRVTLTAPFEPAERCRQMVFWAVDWQSYDDFESAPSAPVDASKYPLQAPKTAGHNVGSLMGQEFFDHHQFSFRNPEKVVAFTKPTIRDLPAGTAFNEGSDVGSSDANGTKDRGTGANEKSVFMGLYGADRNYNGKFDRGPVRKSVRLRAVNVGRFNFYDLRVPAVIR